VKTLYTLEIKLESEHIAFDDELIKNQIKKAIEEKVRPKVTNLTVKSIK